MREKKHMNALWFESKKKIINFDFVTQKQVAVLRASYKDYWELRKMVPKKIKDEFDCLTTRWVIYNYLYYFIIFINNLLISQKQ